MGVLYFFLLFYCFSGVGIIADKFMEVRSLSASCRVRAVYDVLRGVSDAAVFM